MSNAQQMLDQTFLEMRWRCLSLAADLDRVERCPQGPQVVENDPRLRKLREALAVVQNARGADRAERVQRIFSDTTPPPAR